MPLLMRLFRVLQKGPNRAQAWLGVILVVGAAIWVIMDLWKLILIVAILVSGLVLIGRSLRRSDSSSSSSSSS